MDRSAWCRLALLATAGLGCRAPEPAGIPARAYVPGERIRYRMEGTQQGREGSFSYRAESEAVVVRDESGAFHEDTRWVRLEVDGEEVPLEGAGGGFRQRLSLDPRFEMPFPDIRAAHPRLVGPVFDLMTFYVDLSPGLRTEPLVNEGDRAFVPHGRPNSWADGARVVLGEDAIDFELTLERLAPGETSLRVRHVPPRQPAVRLPAEWMRAPVAEAPNNWVQVVKQATGDRTAYVAAVGSESFDVVLTVDPRSGRILRATMDNPVDVVQRVCEDPELARCGEPSKYRIHRRITLTSVP